MTPRSSAVVNWYDGRFRATLTLRRASTDTIRHTTVSLHLLNALKSTFLTALSTKQDAVLSQGLPRDAAVNLGTYQSFQRHWAVFTAIATLSN